MPEGKDKLIIFIVGRRRSGTSFVRNILNLHSDVWISAEPGFFKTGRHKGVFETITPLFPFDTDAKINDLFTLLGSGAIRNKYWENPKLDLERVKTDFKNSAREYGDLIRITLKERARFEGKSIFGEKTPGNIHHIPLLSEWFPDSKFIHIIRDPRAVFVSEINRVPYRHYLFKKSNPISRLFIFIYICFDWQKNIHLHHKYKTAYMGTYLFIRFSQLYTQLEREIKRICDFIGIDFEEAMLDPPRRGSNFPDDYDPLDGWRQKIPRLYDYLFRMLLGRKIKRYT
jgi:hypothetical protein